MNWANRIGKELSNGKARDNEAAGSVHQETSRPLYFKPNTTTVITPWPKAKPWVLKNYKTKPANKLTLGVLNRHVKYNQFFTLGTTYKVPSPNRGEPVRTPDALLFPNKKSGVALYAAVNPVGVTASVLIRTEEVDNTIRTTGGTVTLLVSGLPLKSETEVEALRPAWTSALTQAGHGERQWRFLPLNIRTLDASIDIPSHEKVAEPQVSENSDTATAVYIIELSAAGALAWRQALESDHLESISGAVRFAMKYAAHSGSEISAQTYEITAPISAILLDTQPEFRIVKAEIGVEARLVLRGHPMVDRIAVDLKGGDSFVSEVLDSEGGELALSFATTDADNAQLTWEAEVSFAASNWPVISTRGELSTSAGWVNIVAPSTWVRPLNIITVMVDADGTIAESTDLIDGGLANTVTGSVDLQADFLNGNNLNTSFEAENSDIVNIHLPKPPGGIYEKLALTVFATRDGIPAVATRVIDDDEHWIIVKVFQNDHIEFTSNTSPATESARENGFRGLLESLSIRT